MKNMAQHTNSQAARRTSPSTNQRGHASSSDDQGFFKERGYGTHEGQSDDAGHASQRGDEYGEQWRGYGTQNEYPPAGVGETQTDIRRALVEEPTEASAAARTKRRMPVKSKTQQRSRSHGSQSRASSAATIEEAVQPHEPTKSHQ